jgi:glutamyl-Q tRNA(Asp) synthetase
MDNIIERFAPSPTGSLHLGHAFSALTTWEAVQSSGGTFLLRMDDLDTIRCKPEYAQGIITDLLWLGLNWPEPVLYQSTRQPNHERVIANLQDRGLVYPCFCSRAEIQAAAGAPQEGAEQGPAYPGTCRDKPIQSSIEPRALRLNIRKAIHSLGGMQYVKSLGFEEIGAGPDGQTGWIGLNPTELIEQLGDVVIKRKDGAIAYHLAVVLDDAWQGVTHVTRACDLFASTSFHRLLQALTDSPTQTYRHHHLIRDMDGLRLAKRNGSLGLSTLRAAGMTPMQIRALIHL